MEQASVSQDYEGAAAYRDQIRTLRAVRQKQFVSSDKARDVDIAALVAEGGIICVNLVSVRAGQHRGDKSFFPEHAEGYDATQALEAFLEQHYLNRDVPPLILVNHQIDGARWRNCSASRPDIRSRSPRQRRESAGPGSPWQRPMPGLRSSRRYICSPPRKGDCSRYSRH